MSPRFLIPILLLAIGCSSGGGGGTTPAPVPDFSLALTPPATLQVTGTATAQVTLTRSGGHTSPVTLSVVANAQGITGTGTVAAGSTTGTLTLSAPVTAVPGSTNLVASATDGILTRTSAFSLLVTPAPDYGITLTPPASLVAGSTGTATLAITRSGGHAAALIVTVASNAQGITGTGTVAAGATSGTLTLSVPASAPASTYSLSASATDGTLVHTAPFSLTVTPMPDYGFTVTPPTSLAAGATGNATVTVTRTAGHAAPLTLSLATNAQGITGAGSVASGATSGSLSLTVPASVTTGAYPLSAVASDGSLSHTASFVLNVSTAPGYTFTVTPAAALPVGGTATASVSVQRTGGHTAPLTLSLASNAQGITGTGSIGSGATSGSLLLTAPGGLTAGTYALTATATDGTLQQTAPFSQSVAVLPTLDLSIGALYITQSTQNTGFNVPLVQGRGGYLRVFVVANQANTATPQVRVRFYDSGGTLLQTYTLNAPGASVPLSVNEASLGNSWNQSIPASLLVPGVKLLADIDPAGTIPESSRSNNTWPLSGAAQALDVRTVPTFNVTFWAIQTGDGRVGGVDASSMATYTSLFEKLFPVGGAIGRSYGGVFAVTDTLTSDSAVWSSVLSKLRAKQTGDGASGRYYYGVVNPSYGSGIAGLGYVGGPAAIGWDKSAGYGDGGVQSGVYAHETGHNLGLSHAPCGGVSSYDTSYPYPGAQIGVYGMDLATTALKSPTTFIDVMGYCSNIWISDYNFKKTLNNRIAGSVPLIVGPAPGETGRPRTLLLWGREDRTGSLLEPAFHLPVDAEMPEPGDERMVALDATGQEVFNISFALTAIGCGSEARAFAFSLPVSEAQLARIVTLRWMRHGAVQAQRQLSATQPFSTRDTDVLRLEGGGHRVLWDAGVQPAVLVRDPATGLILGIGTGGELRLPPTGARQLDVHTSDGLRTRTLHRVLE